MKKETKKSQADIFWDAFSRTKIDKRYWKSLAMSFLSSIFSVAVIIAILVFAFSKIAVIYSQINIDISYLQDSEKIVNELVQALVSALAIAGLVLFLFKGFFKGIMWQIISNKYENYYKIKFVVLRILFLVFFVAVSVLIYFAGSFWLNILIFLFFLLIVNILYSSTIELIMTNKLGNSLAGGIKNGVRLDKFALLIIYFALIVLVYIGILYFSFSYFGDERLNLPELVSPTFFNDILISLQLVYPIFILGFVLWLLVGAYLRIFYFEFVKNSFLNS